MKNANAKVNEVSPILVLGLGNIQLHDDGVGASLVQDLAREYQSAGVVEFLDGGTQGLALLSQIAERRALVILDAVCTGHEPGSVCVLEGQDVLAIRNQPRGHRARGECRGVARDSGISRRVAGEVLHHWRGAEVGGSGDRPIS